MVQRRLGFTGSLRRPARHGALAVLLLVFATACISDSGFSTNADLTETASGNSHDAGSAPTTLPDDSDIIPQPIIGPLDAFTIRVRGRAVNETRQDIEAHIEAQFRRQEEYIAACMSRQGFTYIPVEFVSAFVAIYDGPPLGSRQFVERYGFGIADAPLQMRMASEGFDSFDHNWEFVATFSDAEMEAWNEALWGAERTRWTTQDGGWWPLPEAEIAEGGTHTLQDETALADRGCTGRADVETLGFWTAQGPNPTNNDEFRALEDEVNRFPDSVASNPQLLALNSQWAACLTDLGFPGLVSPGQTLQSLQQEWLELVLDAPWVDDLGGGGRREPDADGSFAARELALALADLECREQLDFDAREMEITHALQQEFVDTFGNELEAWASYAEARRG